MARSPDLCSTGAGAHPRVRELWLKVGTAVAIVSVLAALRSCCAAGTRINLLYSKCRCRPYHEAKPSCSLLMCAAVFEGLLRIGALRSCIRCSSDREMLQRTLWLECTSTCERLLSRIMLLSCRTLRASQCEKAVCA